MSTYSTFERGELAILVVPWLEPVAFVLEIIGADIIATITSPLSWGTVWLLGVVVLCELEGEWPWKRRQRAWQARGSASTQEISGCQKATKLL